MKLYFFVLTTFLWISSTLVGAQSLRFNQQGEFKIVQFTDLHIQYHNPASEVAISHIHTVLDAEQPDLVVFTGDLVYAAPADSAMLKVLECVTRRKLPFVVMFGNHDDEQDLSRSQLYDLVRTVPGNLMPDRGEAVSPDYLLRISSSRGTDDAALLYCFDSNSYSNLNGVKGYGWLSHQQVSWYREQSLAATQAHGGQPLPALAFFHIPLPEFHEAIHHDGAVMVGTRMEKVCAPELNSGMFAAMRETGDVMGVFVGHDHDNDYAVMWHDVLLAYGRFSGGNTEYNHLSIGARVIVLEEGKRSFKTWVRSRGDLIEHSVIYPHSFVKDDWRKRK